MLAFPRLTTPRVRTYLYYFTLVTVLFQLQPCYFTDFPRTFLNGQFTRCTINENIIIFKLIGEHLFRRRKVTIFWLNILNRYQNYLTKLCKIEDGAMQQLFSKFS